MITFTNPGLIPLDALRLMGASVKAEGSFGRFGTGFKYALATVLRGGGQLTIWRGPERIDFETVQVEVRGQTFAEVVMVTDGGATRERLGFTTQLGRDWEPWMALRELACNARDEGGDWAYVHPDDMAGLTFGQQDGPCETCILVDWDAMDEAATTGSEHVFVSEHAEVLAEERGVRVLAGPSNYLYHRGVRVQKLPKPSVFTYDIIKPVELTEDRTVKYGFVVSSDIRNMVLDCSDPSVVEAVVSADKDTWEAAFDWKGEDWAPSRPGLVWLEVVAANRERGHVSASAREVLVSHRAFKQVTRGTWEDVTGTSRELSDAAEAMEEMGFDLEKVDVFIVEELPGQAMSAVKEKAIYLTRGLLEKRRHVVVKELLARFLERDGGGDHDRLLQAVSKRFYEVAKARVYWLARDEELWAEEVKAGAEEPLADPLGLDDELVY